MKLQVNRADRHGIIIILIVIVPFGVLVGLAELGYVDFGTPNVKEITLFYMTFSSGSDTLNFTVNNPFPTNSSITDVSVNQTSCIGVFVPLQAESITNESCTVSGYRTFAEGQSVSYAINFSNGQSVSGSVFAQ
jgi:hypothetical protein